jgi:hypothetical protein
MGEFSVESKPPRLNSRWLFSRLFRKLLARLFRKFLARGANGFVGGVGWGELGWVVGVGRGARGARGARGGIGWGVGFVGVAMIIVSPANVPISKSSP